MTGSNIHVYSKRINFFLVIHMYILIQQQQKSFRNNNKHFKWILSHKVFKIFKKIRIFGLSQFFVQDI